MGEIGNEEIGLIPTLALLLGLAAPGLAVQESINGRWEGTMIREGAALAVSFDFTSEAAGLKASFNSPTQRAMGIPLRNVSYAAPKVHFELVGDATTIVFDGELIADTIVGHFREGEATGTFSLRRVAPQPPPFKQEEVGFSNGNVTLSGTLLLPLTSGPHPAVIFLHGSGAEGRFGSRFLAEHFTRQGALPGNTPLPGNSAGCPTIKAAGALNSRRSLTAPCLSLTLAFTIWRRGRSGIFEA